jgi:hypothetical protein
MVRKVLVIDIIFLLFLWLVQLTLVVHTNLNGFLNLPLLYILLRFAVSYNAQIWWLILLLGVLTEIYVTGFFGVQLLVIFGVSWLTYVILFYLFTNRTFFSFLLSIMSGLTIYKFSELLIYYFTSQTTVVQAFVLTKQIGISLMVEAGLIIVFLFISSLFFTKSYE